MVPLLKISIFLLRPWPSEVNLFGLSGLRLTLIQLPKLPWLIMDAEYKSGYNFLMS